MFIKTLKLFCVVSMCLAVVGCRPAPDPNDPDGGASNWVLIDEDPGVCDQVCSGETPFCDAEVRVCVACTTDSHCGPVEPACDRSVGKCVTCVSDAHCHGERPICDARTNTCVAICWVDVDCSEAGFCDSSSGHCVECRDDEDCDDAECDASGRCVGHDDADCEDCGD